MNPNRILADEIYFRGAISNFTITPEIRSALKKLKYKYYDGVYVDKGLSWTLSDNIDVIKEYCPSDMKFEVFLNHMSIACQFIVRTLKMEHLSQEYIKEHDIKHYHINLMNRLYINYESYDDIHIHTADKRPFGNSYMIGDVAEEMGHSRKDLNDSNDQLYLSVYHKILDLTIYVIKEMVVPFSVWVFVGDMRGDKKLRIQMTTLQEKYYNKNWTIDITEHRDMIINEIIN
jgi:hypothetical protein